MIRRLAAAFALSTLFAASAHAGWRFTDLGPQIAYGVNDAGEIVGENGNAGSFDAQGFHPFTFPFASSGSAALAVNGTGIAVGFNLRQQPDDSEKSFPETWTNGLPAQLPEISSAYCCGQANALNAGGTIVGTDFGATFGSVDILTQAFAYSGGVVTALGALPGGNLSRAWAINAAGDIVGESGTDVGLGCIDCAAFLYHAGAMTSLGALPGTTQNTARGINASGVVVGYGFQANGFPLAFVVTNGHLKALPLPAGANLSAANDINDSGQIVGTAGMQRAGSLVRQDAYLYKGGKYTDLSTLAVVKAAGFTDLNPLKINADGVIVGTGKVNQLIPHAFRLTPTAN